MVLALLMVLAPCWLSTFLSDPLATGGSRRVIPLGNGTMDNLAESSRNESPIRAMNSISLCSRTHFDLFPSAGGSKWNLHLTREHEGNKKTERSFLSGWIRKSKGSRARRRIIDQCLQLFSVKGYHTTSVNDIWRSAKWKRCKD